MDKYLDLTKYSDSEIISMLKEKQKEYILLVQSEKVAKMILDYYKEDFFASKYHIRVNNEYYLLYERVQKKNLLSEMPKITTQLEIPINMVVSRIEASSIELRDNNDSNYLSYYRSIQNIISDVETKLYDATFIYRDGNIYLIMDNQELILTSELINNIFNQEKKKTL